MRPVQSLPVVLVLVVTSAVTALHAQERLELITEGAPGIVFEEVDIGLNRFGEIREVTSFAVSPTRSYWVALAGARYLVSPSSRTPELVVFDRRTRRLVGSVSLPFYAHTLVADPMRPRLFVSQSPAFLFSRLGVFDATTLTFREFPAPRSFITGMAYAGETGLLFITEHSFDFPQSLSLYDVATGVRVQRVPLRTWLNRISVDAKGQRVYATGYLDSSFSRQGILLLDPMTGAELASAATEAQHGFALDEARGWVLVNNSVQGRVAVLHATTLATLLDVRINPLPGQEPGLSRSFTPIVGHGRIGAYLLRTTNGFPSPQRSYCYEITLDVFEPNGTRHATADLLAPLGTIPFCGYYAVVLRAPSAPNALAAQVDGRSVTLTWENPGDVSEFEIEVGLSPGTRSLTQRVGLVTAVSVDNVPAGVYYVRIKAINEVGTSPASNEVRVVVP